MTRLLLIAITLLLTAQATPRVRTTQRQLHSSAAVVQTIDAGELDTAQIAPGVDPDGIVMKGFSKRASDTNESFFLTSRLTHRVSSVRLLMRYTTMDGTLLHERKVVVPIDLPPGATRLVQVKTFDRQRMFYYYGGPKPRKSATPFRVAYRLTGYDIPVGD